MRGRALAMGYSLNEHGMYKMDGKQKGAKIEQRFENEASIFDFLKMKYKNPEDRKDGRSIESILTNTIIDNHSQTVVQFSHLFVYHPFYTYHVHLKSIPSLMHDRASQY